MVTEGGSERRDPTGAGAVAHKAPSGPMNTAPVQPADVVP
jgi:hypothetical protein